MSIKLSLYKTALRKKTEKGFQGYPAAAVIFYGPDDRCATKVIVGIEEEKGAERELTRWHSQEMDIRRDAAILESIVKLIRRRDVKSLAMTEQILGCPHEEGVDYPDGDVCPECPFWANRPRPIFDDDEEPEPGPQLPNPRTMEKIMAGIGGGRQSSTPLNQAQEMMWDAWEEPNRGRRIQLAKKALTISPDCADAYVLLAEDAALNLYDATQYFEDGVRAGERALGEKAFTEHAGSFWGILETRPYMRARAGLAECLQRSGKMDEAIAHYGEMLRLNPNDNQGIRDLLSVCYIASGRDREAVELLDRYPEGITASWLYTAALLAFRSSGADADARRKLQDALKRNPHVPDYLLGRKKMPRSLPSHYSIGSADEAIIYADSHCINWQKSDGALEWLKRELAS